MADRHGAKPKPLSTVCRTGKKLASVLETCSSIQVAAPGSDLRRPLQQWALRATLAAALAATAELIGTLAQFPTAASRLPGLAAAWLGSWWIFSLWLTPLAVAGAALDARATLPGWLERRGLPFHALAPLVLSLVAVATAQFSGFDRVQVNEGEIRLLGTYATVGAAWVAVFAGARLLRRSGGQWLARVDGYGLMGIVVMAAVVLPTLIHAVLAPANADRAIWPFGLAWLGCVLLAIRIATHQWAPLPRWTAPALVSLWLLAIPAWSTSSHGLFVLRGHCPTATSLFVPVDDLFDWDGDGASTAWVGGTDCDDLNATVGPLMIEVPGDGIDQDCRGGDAQKPSRQRIAPPWDNCVRAPRPPSILLITVDALRADALTAEITPELSRFAQHASRFRRAYAPASMTGGTTLSMFTGRALSDLNAHNVYTDERVNVDGIFPTAFRQAGYRSFALLPFDVHPAILGGLGVAQHTRPRDTNLKTVKRLLAADLSNQLLEEVTSTAQRYFGWVHYPDLHAPYIMAREEDGGETTPGYLRAARYVDGHVGRVLRFLSSSGRLQTTIVIVSADHGEQLGQRGRQGHGPLLFEEGIAVPLLVWVPGCPPREIDHPVSLRHLAGTLRALTGIGPVQPTWFSETDLPLVVEEPNAPWNGVKRATLAGRHKLIVDARLGGKMLFDLQDDPGEVINLYDPHSELTQAMEREYQRWLDSPMVR